MSNPMGMAPVCNINPPQPPPASTAPYIPSFVQPNVQDPQSIISAITQLQFALIAITGNNIPNNVPIELSALQVATGKSAAGGVGGGGSAGGGGGGGGSAGGRGGASNSGQGQKSTQNPKTTRSEFIEINRTTKLVKVVNPQNTSQYVMVKQIVALTMFDKVTGETWTWKQ